MKTHFRKFAAGLLVTSILAGPLAAQKADPAVPSTTAPESAFGVAAVAGDDTLEAATAREDVSLIAQSQQTSNVSNNSVNGTSTTGEIRFSDNAFESASGLTIINANSGNNVGMNASINVNIVMSPPQQ